MEASDAARRKTAEVMDSSTNIGLYIARMTGCEVREIMDVGYGGISILVKMPRGMQFLYAPPVGKIDVVDFKGKLAILSAKRAELEAAAAKWAAGGE